MLPHLINTDVITVKSVSSFKKEQRIGFVTAPFSLPLDLVRLLCVFIKQNLFVCLEIFLFICFFLSLSELILSNFCYIKCFTGAQFLTLPKVIRSKPTNVILK